MVTIQHNENSVIRAKVKLLCCAVLNVFNTNESLQQKSATWPVILNKKKKKREIHSQCTLNCDNLGV